MSEALKLTPERGPLASASAQSDGIRSYQRAIAFPSLRLRARAARPEPSQSRSHYNGGCVRKRPGDSAVTPPIRVNSEPGSAIALGTVRVSLVLKRDLSHASEVCASLRPVS